MFSSWETIAHRTAMIAAGTCSPAEYQRMTSEKTQAAWHSAIAMLTLGHQGDVGALLSPWHRRAKANAKRLRRK